MLMKRTSVFLCVLSALLAISCCRRGCPQFDPMVEFPDADTVLLDMDMDNDVVMNGIVIPSARQTASGYFHFAFDTAGRTRLYYKIYYQNDTYRFEDDDSLNYENFYGSWEDVSVGFRPVPSDGHVRDSFRIVGNPRDERQYYGVRLEDYDVGEEALLAIEREIRRDTHWFNYVKNVAAPKNGRTLEEQLFLDTRYVLNERKHAAGNVNHRWKRNPRTGCYTFLLVVCDEEGLALIPDPVQKIGAVGADSHYVNPIAWFRKHRSRHISLVEGSKVLRTRAVLSPSQGIYLDELQLRTSVDARHEDPGRVGSDSLLAHRALYQQFFPAVSQQYTLRNIPLVKDIENYSLADYEASASGYRAEDLMLDYPQITREPGATVRLSPEGDYIAIVNPGNAGAAHPKKESTGVKTRVGFTYGKFRGRIKFPRMLNRENVWNGLTYAFWLIYQDDQPWNLRRPSYHGGYIDKGDDSESPQRMLRNKYSEIDIEIVKAAPFWPKGSSRKPDETESCKRSSDVMFCCTNWDLACPEPGRFASGITNIRYKHHKFEALRWSDLYKALTTKTPMPNSVFDSVYYCYEIEWRPKEIVWRLGPDPKHMRVVGYMSDAYTCIPNNQMLCVVTQEYHYSEWWPPVVFEQGRIPFNASDIEGRVYDIVVE